MLYFLGEILENVIGGPSRLFRSYAVLIIVALYSSFFITRWILPKCFSFLPHDRGRQFAQGAQLAIGKPTGAGIVFISVFVLISLLVMPLVKHAIFILALTWLTMLTGFLDDKSYSGWGEYRKAALDLVLCVVGAFLLNAILKQRGEGAKIQLWLPLWASSIGVPQWCFIVLSTVILWGSINTTNCTDGVDGLSGTLVLVALLTLGIIFYFILGHAQIAAYLLVPHIKLGAQYAIMAFALAGALCGYLWYNAYPSSVLMGDAGSRALGFFIGIMVLLSGNPFIIFATSSIMLVNGGMGLLKVALLRFFGVKILASVIFPLHDHVRKIYKWSATQVLLKFLIMQLLITIVVIGFIFKVR